MEDIAHILANELEQKQEHVENVIRLIDEGNTIPFIAPLSERNAWYNG